MVDRSADTFTVDVMAETLKRSTIGTLAPGDEVNLERSVTAATRLGGHIVQGHVDGTGIVTVRIAHPAYDEIRIAVGPDVARYLAGKGAVAVDGISLTVIDVVDNDDGAEFGIGVIPETRAATTMGAVRVGDRVNLEVDVVAKYVERLLAARDRERHDQQHASNSGHRRPGLRPRRHPGGPRRGAIATTTPRPGIRPGRRPRAGSTRSTSPSPRSPPAGPSSWSTTRTGRTRAT